MNATISISKVITVITDNSVFYIKASEFVSEILKYNEIELKGWFSIGKYDKYTDLLKENGFKESVVYFRDLHKDLSIDFRIKFGKL